MSQFNLGLGYNLIVILPLVGFLYNYFIGYKLGRPIGLWIGIGFTIINFDLCMGLLNETYTNQIAIKIKIIEWLITENWIIEWSLKYDTVSVPLCLVIIIITGLTQLYSIDYMIKDPRGQLFNSFLSLFSFCMLVLVTADNLILMYAGWEGVGVASFLLIGFWNTRYAAAKAASKAMITNRISDIFFLLGILLIIHIYGSPNFEMIVLIQSSLYKTGATWGVKLGILIAGVCVLIGAIGKSAQLILHVWLPDAMEGPTPVSALLHAATMVTAGVILLIKLSWIFVSFPRLSVWTALVGSVTTIWGSCAGLFQNDVKKVIAYSTCSQLGYMVMACGLNYYNVAIFHLFNHAFFKALLFLGAGAIIHAVGDEQDIRKMGGLSNFLPFTLFCMIIGSLAIMGIPFLAGFYSKDLILELTFNSYLLEGWVLYFFALFGAFFTSLYSIRLIYFVFFGKPKSSHTITPADPPYYMNRSLIILLILSSIVGYLFNDYFIGMGNNLLTESVSFLPLTYYYTNIILINPINKNLPLLLTIIAWIIGLYLMNITAKPLQKPLLQYRILRLNYILGLSFYHTLFFNNLYNSLFILLYKYSYFINIKLIDKGLWEYIGPIGVYRILNLISGQFRVLTPAITIAIGFMFFGIIILYFYLVISNIELISYTLQFGVWISLLCFLYYEFSYKY